MKKGSKQKQATKDDGLLFIKNALERKMISKSEVESLSRIDYPLFSFKYFNDLSMKNCKEPQLSQTHSFGMEPMPKTQIKHQGLLPSFVTKEVDLHLFRAVGDNRVMVGLQEGKIFHVFFVEAKFGDVSPH